MHFMRDATPRRPHRDGPGDAPTGDHCGGDPGRRGAGVRCPRRAWATRGGSRWPSGTEYLSGCWNPTTATTVLADRWSGFRAAAARRRHHGGVVRLRRSDAEPERPRQWFSECEVHLDKPASVWAALSVLADLGLRSRFSSIEQRRTYFVALRTGELPPSVDAEEYGRWLGRSTMAHAIAPFAWGLPLWFGGILEPVQSVGVRPGHGLGVRAALRDRRRRLRSPIPAPRTLACRIGATSSAMAETETTVADAPEEAWLTVSPVARALVLATTGFTIALLALVLADLDSVVFGDARLEHLKWACAWAAPLSLVSPIAVLGDPTTRRRGGAVEPLIDYERAVRTGELPSESNPRCGDVGCARSAGSVVLGCCGPASLRPSARG